MALLLKCATKNMLKCIPQMQGSDWLEAIIQQPWRLEHAPLELQGDREIALAAVTRDGATLRCATLELRSDHDIVQTAVQSDWEALRYIPEALRGDEAGGEALIRTGMLQDVAAVACGNRDLRMWKGLFAPPMQHHQGATIQRIE